jgi:hypothetical protein
MEKEIVLRICAEIKPLERNVVHIGRGQPAQVFSSLAAPGRAAPRRSVSCRDISSLYPLYEEEQEECLNTAILAHYPNMGFRFIPAVKIFQECYEMRDLSMSLPKTLVCLKDGSQLYVVESEKRIRALQAPHKSKRAALRLV